MVVTQKMKCSPPRGSQPPRGQHKSFYSMFYLNREDRHREALAQDGLHALAQIAGWQIEPCPAFLPPAVHGYFYSSKADLILAPWRKNMSLRRLIAAAREVRLDVLLIEPTCCRPQTPTFRASLILCRAGETSVFRSLELWAADVEGPVWLVPDFADRDASPACFDLQRNRMAAEDQQPFSDIQSRELGLLIGAIRWTACVGGHLI